LWRRVVRFWEEDRRGAVQRVQTPSGVLTAHETFTPTPEGDLNFTVETYLGETLEGRSTVIAYKKALLITNPLSGKKKK
jgi:hypothetical protein